ncbi:MAG: InlB B-repeat-containing protein [Lachnospiraceae bacterium]|nr:InlB B-repeat-containing protein [Lachnospiraceae bacterium]
MKRFIGLALSLIIAFTSQTTLFAAEEMYGLSAERQAVLDAYNQRGTDSAEDSGSSGNDASIDSTDASNNYATQTLTSDYVEPSYYTQTSETVCSDGYYLELIHTDNVPFDNKKHVGTQDKSKSKSVQKDLYINAYGSVLSFSTLSYKYKNNKKVASSSDKKSPSIIVKLKANKGATKSQKEIVNNFNKIIKKSPFKFTISALDVTDLEPTIKWSKDKSKIKNVMVNYHDKKLKISKKNVSLLLNENGTYLLKFDNNFTGYYSNDIWLMPNYKTVTFDTNSDISVPAQRIKKGSYVTEPQISQEKYSVGDWYSDKEMTPSSKFSFSDAVTSDMTLYADWKKMVPDYLMLEADDEQALTGDDSNVVMYITTDAEVDSIDLYKDGVLTTKLYDDGNYSSSYDDMKGDGIYSCMLSSSYSSGDFSFYAQCGGVKSNDVTITYVDPFTSEELDNMDTVNDQVDTFVDSDAFQSNSIDQNYSAGLSILNDMVTDGFVKSGSISRSDDGTMLIYEYTSGVKGGIPLEDPAKAADGKYMNGEIGGGTRADTVTENDEEVNIESALPDRDKAEASDEEGEASLSSTDGNDGAEPNSIKPLATTDTTSGFSGKALILNVFPAFERTADSIAYRTDFYKTLKSTWDNKGLSTDLIVSDDVTVDKLKTMAQYDVVDIATHGTTFGGSPAILLHEEASPSNNKKYAVELRTGSIVQVGNSYYVLPAFFENEYSDNELQNTFVFSESCEFLGHGKGGDSSQYNYSMSQALISHGCPVVIGCHNSVFASYIRNIMAHYVDKLVSGKTAGQAFDSAIEQYGSNHKKWFESTYSGDYETWWKGENPSKTYDANEEVAYPTLCGDRNATLIVNAMKNGDFEQYYKQNGSIKPMYWSFDGDVRSVNKLGSAEPKNTSSKKMAMLTTGIGSQSTSLFYDDGTEGSRIYQTVMIPNNASVMTFDYNFISEEPMEYVHSIYDDSFGVVLTQGSSRMYQETFESINSSDWYEIRDVDFYEGDSTAYQTGWKSRSVDVSAYRGEALTIEFVIYDKGDEIYDSACLLDDIVLK